MGSPGELGRAPAHEAAPVCGGLSCRDASGCAGLGLRCDGGKMLRRSTRLAGLHSTGGVPVARCPGHGGGEQDMLGSPGLIS